MNKVPLEETTSLITNISFLIDEKIENTFKNIEIETLNKITKGGLIRTLMIETKWYMYGVYDKIEIDEVVYVIISKTKRKIELVRMNENK